MYIIIKSMKYRLFALGILLLASPGVHADISGKVFLDYNLNGQLDNTSTMRNFANTHDIHVAVDTGVAGAEIRAECVTASGKTAFGPVTTNTNGQFTLPTPAAIEGSLNCVVQLSTLPAAYAVATQAGAGNILTQFVSPTSDTANFAVQQAASYCQNNPDLVTSRYANGQQTHNIPWGGNHDVANLFGFPYNSGVSGQPLTLPTGYDVPKDADAAKKNLALASEVGSVFGLGWHPASKSLFSAAYMKPWTGFGTGGTGGIYRTNISDPTNPVTVLYADLNQIFPSAPPTAGEDPYLTGVFSPANPGYAQISDGTAPKGDGTNYPDGSYVPSGDATRDNQDGQISNALGKVAFGDLDVTSDGTSIVVVNMADRHLYVLPVQETPLSAADAGKIERYPIPFESTCKADGVGFFDKAAFGLGEYQKAIYVATRCDTGWAAPLFSMFRFDRQTKTFTATPSMSYKVTGDIYGLHFEFPSDIAFNQQGNAVLAFREVMSEGKAAGAAYGVVRHLCVQDASTHTWVMENNGSCAGVTTAGKDSGQGPFGGDFFFQEWPVDQGANYHQASYGGAAHIPGFLESAYTIADPFQTFEAGVSWFDLGLGDVATAGQRNRGYGFYRGTGAFTYPDNRPINGKQAAIGDLEVMCDNPAVEIGNRVWEDKDGNGIQDAGEPAIAGVKVELFAQGADVESATPLATALTDVDGYYVFSGDGRGYPMGGNTAPNDTAGNSGGFDPTDIQGGRASTASRKYGLVSLRAATTYQVVIRHVDGGGKQSALAGLFLTPDQQGSDAERNSDGQLSGIHAVAVVMTLDSGKNTHAVDFGFKNTPAPPVTHSIGNRIWFDTNNNGTADSGEQHAGNGIKLELKDSTGNAVLQTTTTDANGRYLFHGLTAGNYQVCVTADNFAAGSKLEKYRSSTGQADTEGFSTDGTDRGDDNLSNGSCSTIIVLDDKEPTGEYGITDQQDGADGQGTPDTHSNLTVDFGFVPPTDLKLVKTVDKASAKRGDMLTYTLTLSNESAVTATGVQVTDQLPAGVLYVSDDSAGAYTPATGLWSVGSLAANATKTLKITVTVK